MNTALFSQNIHALDPRTSIQSLESGQVLFFPDYHYDAVDNILISERILDAKHKNVSYDYKKKKLSGYKKTLRTLEAPLNQLMQGYAEFSLDLIAQVLPSYRPHVQWGRTSYRPAQISNRAISKRKDDRRLHVDSFPASPVNGRRILRVFCNVNPRGEPRVWHLGEPFTQVVQRFAPGIPRYSKVKAQLLRWLRATKSLRSAYDHRMLHLHDRMKLDDRYQNQVRVIRCDFPSQSSWIVFTDQVSHAALSGQYLLEQTFYLPVERMNEPDLSPLHVLNAELG